MFISMKAALIGGIAIIAIAGITVGIVFATKGGDCEGFFSPRGLKFEEKDDKLYLMWSTPDNVGDCTAKYKIVLTVNDEQQKAVETEGLSYEITDVAVCSKIVATVTTIDENGDESDKATTEYTLGSGDVSQVVVENLNAVVAEDKWVVNWNQITDYDYCEIKYALSVNDISQGEPISDIIATISNDILAKCDDNKIAVVPVIQSQLGKETSKTIVAELGDVSTVPVSDLSASFSDNVWTVEWSKPSGYSACDIKYVIYFDDEELEDPISEETLTIVNDDLQMCISKTIGVMPVINDNNGEVDSVDVKGDVGDVSEVTVTIKTPEFTDDVWNIGWEALSLYEECNVKYLVYLNGAQQGEPISETTTTISNSLLNICVDNDISVKPQIDGKDGKEAEVKIKGEVGDISEVTVTVQTPVLTDNTWTIEWTKPTGFDACDIKYLVSLNNQQQGGSITETTTTILDSLLAKCVDNDIGVKPIIQDNSGKETTVQVKGDVADVSEVTVTVQEPVLTDGVWTIVWTKPTGFDYCDVKYLVSLNNAQQGGIITETTTTISNNLLNVCVNNDVKVKPIIEDKDGKEAPVQVKGDVGDVSEVTVAVEAPILTDDAWTIEWTKPTGFDDCDIKYSVSLGGTQQGELLTTTTTTISNSLLTKCIDNNIEVKPVIEDKNGKAAAVTAKGDVGDVSEVTVAVEAPILTDDAWTIVWTKPTGFDDCDIKYLVSLGGAQQGGLIAATTTTISNSLLTKCVDNSIEVKPVIEDKDGKEATVQAKGEPEISGRVIEGKIEVHPSDLVKVSWNKAVGLETCDFKYNLQLLKNNEPIGSVADLDTESWEKTVADVAACADVTVSITAVYNSAGEAASFSECTDVPETIKYFRGRAMPVRN